jgi:trehalose/maltose hydrolase-like predicted phosphorylase
MANHGTNSPFYKLDEWKIIEEYSQWKDLRDHWYQSESIFAIGNGSIGMRGSVEEGFEHAVHPNNPNGIQQDKNFFSVDGTYINGFYESQKIAYPEAGYAFAKNSQTMLNVPNGKMIRVLLDDGKDQEALHIDTGVIEEYTRTLNMDTGLLERRVIWNSPKKHLRVLLEVKRLVSFERPHLAAIEFRLTPYFTGRVQFESVLDGHVENVNAQSDPRVGSHLDGCVLRSVDDPMMLDAGGILKQETSHSNLILASGMVNVLDATSQLKSPTVTTGYVGDKKGKSEKDNVIKVIYDVKAENGKPITLHKYLAYEYAEKSSPSIKNLVSDVQKELASAQKAGFAKLVKEQSAYMKRFWEQASVSIKGKNEDIKLLQQGVRFNMFHLLQAAGRDGKTNISSKGMTGEGYEGHYFWDTEMFAAPFFQYVDPEICRDLLQYRYNTLKYARQRARDLSHTRGAAYAWRTINGEECSAFFPAGTAQYHINADIAYAIKSYVASTGDTQFLIEQGAEIVFETARLWADLGEYVPTQNNRFCIHGVTGPDEYTAIVDNNCYTNLMAQDNLRYAYQVAQWLKVTHPKDYEKIASRLQPYLAEGELSAWSQAADAMYIPYDEQTGLFAQDDGFLDRAAWRWDWGKRDGKEVLLNRFHYLVIYRHQVSKQADVMLALYLLPDRATLEQKRRNFNYYEQITTHDSSLSTCTFGIVASEIGYHARAYNYFMQTARTDLDDHHGNVTAGVHIANMAGTWMSLVNGFAGLRLELGSNPGESIPHYKPYLPDEWDEYSFRVCHQHAVLQMTVNRKIVDQNHVVIEAEYTLILDHSKGQTLKLKHHDIPFELDQHTPKRTFVLVD